MRKKFLLTMFSLVLFAFCGTSLHAQDAVAKVGNTEYAKINDAIANWTNGTTLTLLADVTLPDVVTLKSTEHHILNLGTYTMTAASGMNAIVIKACGNGSAERTAITINADATNPGGINAGSKCVLYYKYADGGITTEDRPIIQINGGVFTGATSSIGTTGIHTIGKESRKCATLNISGGTFNCSINGATKSKLIISGGVFNYSVGSTGDSTALRKITGGKFKSFGWMTNDNKNGKYDKFTIGTNMEKYDVGVYVDKDGYLCIGGPVITELSAQYPAKASNYSKWSSHLMQSSAATYGLFYEDAAMAIKKHGEANVTIWEKPAVTIPENVTGDAAVVAEIKNNTALKDYTPENLPAGAELEIELKSVGETFVFDVTPMANGAEVEELTEAITFRLPVPASVTKAFAKVSHDGEAMGIYAIQGEVSAKYVEITSKDFSEFAVEPYEVATYDQLLTALKNDSYVMLTDDITGTATESSGYGKAGIVLDAGKVLDGNGKTLTINGADATWDCAIAMRGGEVKNLTIAGAMRGVFMPGANGDVVIDNCKFKNVVYTFNSDAGSTEYAVTIKNTTLNGWTSFSAVHKAVTFESCTFGKGSGYAFCRPYQATTFTDCEFNEGYEFDTSKAAENSFAFKNCTYNGVELSAENNAMFYNGGSVVINGVNTNVTSVAQISDKKYTSLEAAVAAAQAGETITMLADATISEKLTLPAGITLNGNGKQINGEVWADGNLTFVGHTKVTTFNAGYNKPTITIGEGACLELTGTGRMVLGHGCTFNITGTIAEAKTANVADVTPSLVMPGASFTGAGVTFNVTNAYIKTTASYCSSSKSASSTFDFNIQNSIWENAGKLAFESQSTAATVNFDLKNSVLNTGSHLVFGVSRGEIVVDNSNVNVGKSNQIENQSIMTIKNGSVVNGAVATSSNAKNPGTVIVENATYAVTGEFSGSDLGTGTLIIKKGATVSAGSITKANITIDAEGMTASDAINLTANLSKLAGELSVINNDKLEAKIVDGKIVLAAKPVAKIGDTPYTTLEDAFKAATEGQTITLLADATPALTSQRAITKAAVIDLDGKTLNLTEDDLYFGTTTFKNGTIVVDPLVKPSTAVFWMFANQTLTFDAVKIVATGVTGTYLIGLEGENSDLNLLNSSEILVENTTTLDLDIICVNGTNTCDIKVENSKVNVTNLDGRVFFRGNYTVKDSEVNLEGITKAGFRIEAGQTLSIEGTSNVTVTGELRDGGIHLTDASANYTKAETATVNATVNEPKVAKIGETTYKTLQAAIEAVQEGETIILVDNVNVTTPAYGQNALNHARAINFTLDLNGKTLSANTGNSVFRFNIANSGATSDVTLTIKNGKIVAGSNTWCAVMASGISSDVKAIMNLENLTIEASKAGDLAVKAWDNATINANNVTVNATNAAGGFYAVGGEIVLDNCTVNQKGLHTAPYLSMAFAVSSNGKMTINSGTYSAEPTAAAEGSNQGSTHGSWVGGVMNSGGELIINGGTFSNGNFGDNALATAARGLIFADTNGKVTVNGGTFNALKSIFDFQNNLGATSPVITVKGGSYSADPAKVTSYGSIVLDANYVAVENNGVWNVVKAAAKIDKQGYATIKDAIAAVKEGETITILAGTHSEGTIKLPATLKNVTLKGVEGAILKDMTISAADGNSYSYVGLTFDGITFDNSRLLFTGWRNGEETIENFTVTNCTFKNLYDTTNNAALHFNKDASEAVKNFTFTNNVIDGATGGSKSGIYLQATGDVTITGNTFKNIVFRPALVQLADCDGVADNVVISNNNISNTTRLQVYGTEEGPDQGPWTPAGTDVLVIEINNNIFQNITGYYICTWGINGQTDITKNYYDSSELGGKIYWNNEKPADEAGLVALGVYPIYTELNADGTINTNSAYCPPVAKVGETSYNTLAEAIEAAQGGTVTVLTNVNESIDAICNVTLKTDVEDGVIITNTFTDDYVDFNNVNVGNGVTLNMKNVYSAIGTAYATSVNTIEGSLNVSGTYYHSNDAKTTIQNGGKVATTGMTVLRYNNNPESGIYIYGDGNDETVEFTCANTFGAYSGTLYVEKAVIKTNMMWLDYWKNNSGEGDAYPQINANFNNSTINVASEFRLYKDASLTLNGTNLTADKVQVRENATPTVNVSNSTIKANTVENLAGATINAIRNEDGTVTFKVFTAKIGDKLYTLTDAIAAAQTGETIYLINNVVLADGITIAKSITIDGNGKKVTPADASKTYNSAFMVGDSGWGDDHGETITIKGVVFEGWNTNYGVVRAQGVTLAMDGCEFNRCSVSNAAYAVLSLNHTDATVENTTFANNNDRVIDVNYNADSSEAVVTIDGCTFNGNTTDGAGIIYKNAGDVKVKNSIFVNNNVSTNGNAATVYTGWGSGDEVSGCTFASNTVITSSTSTKRFASAIFCDGCVVKGNVFGEGNTATRNGEAISTIVAVGAYYGAADISENYWGGSAPVAGVDYTVEYNRNDVAIESYYSDAELSNLVNIAPVAKVGKYYYTSLEAALAVESNEEVTLLVPYVVAAGETVILDLNGKTVSQSKECTASYEMILNKGNLTIKNGKLSFKDTSAGDPNFGWGSYTVRNEGTLVVEETATIEHLGEQNQGNGQPNVHMYCAIFQYSGSTTINGGTISTPTYRSVRLWKGDMTINGGTFEGQVWVQAVDNSADLTINGGTFAPRGNDGSSVYVENSSKTVAFEVTGGKFETKIGVANAEALAGCITGGQFSEAAVSGTNPALLPTGFIFGNAQNGYSTVVDDPSTLYITNLDELKAFRDAVNAGNTYAGVTVYLATDIDLNNEDWTPIGTSANTFNGMFDGQKHTINNLYINDSKGYVSGGNNDNYVGLFGYMKGGNTSGIKNLNIHNVNITGCLYVGSVLGRSYTGGIIENCHVSGNISIDSYAYTGGIVGRHEYSGGANENGETMSIYNCSVKGEINTRSANTINADYAVSYVGGIVGFVAEGDYVFENCEVENVTISGIYGVGGISGIAHYGNTISEVSADNVSVISTNNDPENNRTGNIGLIVGAVQGTEAEPSIIEDISIENTTANVTYTDGTTEQIFNIYGTNMNGSTPVTNYVAQIVGGTQYTSVIEALQAAIDTEASELVILKDVREKMTVDFDLVINADLTITAATPVKVEFYNEGTSLDFAVGSTNNNTLTIDENVHFNLTDRVIWLGYYGNNVDVVVKGYLGGYQIWHGADTQVTATGKLDSHGEAFIMRRNATLTVVDGEVNANYFHIYSGHINAENATITAGLVWIYNNHNYGSEGTVSMSLDNTSFTSNGVVTVYAGEGKQVPITLTNGTTFTAAGDLTTGENVNITADATSDFIVKGKSIFVAETGDYKYASLAAAIEAAGEGATVTVISDINLTEGVTVAAGKVVTLDLNGKVVSYTSSVAGEDMITNNGNLTIVDSQETTGKITYNNTDATGANVTVSTISTCPGSTLVVNGGTIENKTVKADGSSIYSYAIDILTNGNLGDVNVTINGGTVYSDYMAIRQFNNGTACNNSLTIKGGYIYGAKRAVQVHMDNNAAYTTIVNGKVEAGADGYSLCFFPTTSENISVLGGEFIGNVYSGSNGFITGGTFTTDVNEYCAEDFSAIQQGPNSWVVKQVSGTLTRTLPEGWSWFSSYVDLAKCQDNEGNDNSLAVLENALEENGVQIKDNAGQAYVNYSNGKWRGSLATVSSETMYAIKTSAEHTLEITGEFYDINEYEVSLRNGWNYLSYPHYEAMPVVNALGFTPANGDAIKGKGVTAFYLNNSWIGAFSLTPGEGYMYYSNEAGKEFSYSTEETRSSVKSYVSESSEYWTVDASQYPSNMTMIATLDVEGADYEVAAFVDGEVRGSARPIYVDFLDQYIVIMTINGENVANVTFKYYDLNAGEEYDFNNVVVYSNNAILGSIESPYALTRGTTGIGENSLNDINIYPNPTTTDREINLQATCDKVEVFNTLGVKVAEYQNVDTIDALETAGTYVIRVTLNGDVKHCRLVVK